VQILIKNIAGLESLAIVGEYLLAKNAFQRIAVQKCEVFHRLQGIRMHRF
jgi:hypothetical protein